MNNRNPQVLRLLEWHAHDKGGVAVPFQSQNPVAEDVDGVIETGLIRRLRKLAFDAVNGTTEIALVFLIGGPGNGKSEAVQSFLRDLDGALDADGLLASTMTERFRPNPEAPWIVQLELDELPELAPLREAYSRIAIIQDASATEDASLDASAEFVDAVASMVTPDATGRLPLVICCMNRGLLARSLRSARRHRPDEVSSELLGALVEASAAASGAGIQQSCWPLQLGGTLAGRVASWPLDAETLVEAPQGSTAPIDDILQIASREDRWEMGGSCDTCAVATSCPFRQNASWIRESRNRSNLLTLLRRSELANGQRLTFRDAFSLAAELIVGDRTDFADSEHPCDWVGGRVAVLHGDDRSDELAAAFDLMARLYVHALYPTSIVAPLASMLDLTADATLTAAAARAFGDDQSARGSHVRRLLRGTVARRLDPASSSPSDAEDDLAVLEDQFSSSVNDGKRSWEVNGELPGMADVERRMLNLLVDASREWDVMAKEKRAARAAHAFLAATACVVAKRSVGTRIGHHAHARLLDHYSRTIHDEPQLAQIALQLTSLMSTDAELDLIATFGQPSAGRGSIAAISGLALDVEDVFPAPRPDDEDGASPGHDLPSILMDNSTLLPLSFDLFRALVQQSEGCELNSLPASTRAALDRVKHLHAGRMARDDKAMRFDKVKVRVAGGKVRLDPATGMPRLEKGNG